jgi:hypothetical protein
MDYELSKKTPKYEISVDFVTDILDSLFSLLYRESQGLIVDQTIEKVSFCAPDRNHEKGFSYICRDGTTRRWMCHGFLASKDSVRIVNELLSIQQRERETSLITPIMKVAIVNDNGLTVSGLVSSFALRWLLILLLMPWFFSFFRESG